MSLKSALIASGISLLFVYSTVTATCASPPLLIDPCDLITHMEAEEIMGESMQDGTLREQKATGMKLCLYEAADDNSFAMLQISIVQGQTAKETFSVIKNNFPDHEMVGGIGDDAFIATPGVHILKNDCYLTIAAGNLSRNRDKALAAGEKSVANLEIKLK